MNPHPKVSVVIPHWNGIGILSECIQSLQKSTYSNLEIVVVDNMSTDGSQTWIKTNYPSIMLIENDENYGYAGGCNRGVPHCSGEYIIFLNNDTIQDPGWIESLLEVVVADPSIAAAQPTIRNYHQRDLFDYSGGAGGAMDFLGFPFAKGRVFFTQETDNSQYSESTEIFWASGTAMIVQKDLFIKAGGFDETFFAHMEEIDLCWRFYLMGHCVRSAPLSIVYHKNAVTLPQQSIKKHYLNHRNSLLMMLSNYSLPLMLYLIPVRLALEGATFFFAVFMRDWRHAAAVIKAFFWVLLHPLVIVKKRKRTKDIRKEKDKTILEKMYRGSVVFDYYLRGKRTYREIQSNPER